MHRDALIKQLHAGIGHGLIVLQAPAGYGKTALLSDFITGIDYSVRWLSLDSSAAVPEAFAAQLASALLGDDAAEPPAALGRNGDIGAYLGALLARAADSDDPVLLVIDNAHELNDSDESLDILEWLIDSVPEGFEIVISGRQLPALLTIDQDIATGAILVLDAASLAFSQEEIEALCKSHAATVTPDEVRAHTFGWPIAVTAMVSGAVSGRGPRGPVQSAAWTRFLTSQIWDGVPADVRRPFLVASTMVAIDTRLPEGPNADLAPLLAWLQDHEFLYESLDEYHLRLTPIFRKFLLDTFSRDDPAAFARAVAHAIADCEASGDLIDCFELARTTSQFGELIRLIETHGAEFLRRGSFQLLWHAIEHIPPALLAKQPVVAALRARVQAHIGANEAALDAARQLLDDQSVRGSARLHALLARARALRLTGDHEALRTAFGTLRAVDCEDAVLLSELNYHEAEVALSVDNDLARAGQLLRQTIRQAHLSGARVLELLATSTLGQMLLMQGEGPDAVATLVGAVAGWRALPRSSNLGWTLNNLGMAYLTVGDFESATTVLEEARREGIQCENRRNEAYATASLGDAELALGHWEAARAHYEATVAICADRMPDQTLAALSISGLSAALLGTGDSQQADFFSRRALLVAAAAGSAFELATCKLQQAAVDSAHGRHDDAIAIASDARELFARIESRAALALAQYRLALCQFRAGHRTEAQQSLRELDSLIGEPWMVAALTPLIRENPMFAQWAASRNLAGAAFREYIERQAFEPAPAEEAAPVEPTRFPAVVARSLGQLSVAVGGREVTEEAWASARARELFYLFLSRRQSGLRKEEAVELLYPDLPREKCNSAFHSNLYRLRRALYQDSVVKRDGGYILNPEGAFTWDVETFESALDAAGAMDAGSPERAAAYEDALRLYQGPFAEAFYSEWAASVRDRVASRSYRALATLAGFYAGRGEFAEAATCIQRILDESPFNEEAAYQLAAFRSRAGDRSAALAFLDSYRRSYEAEFGEALPARFGELRRQIASGALAS